MKKHIGKILVALVVVYLLVNMAAVITYPNQYKVIKTMGKISRVTTEPGFSFRIPLIQSETTISKARQLYDIAPTEIYTSDKKKMEVDAYIIWRVTDPVKFTQTLNSSTASAESKISAMVYGSLKATVSSTSQEELIASRDAALDKAEEDDTLDVEVQDITSEDLKEDTEASSGAGSTGAAGTETTGTESKEQSKETEDGMTVIDENTRVISLSNKILEQLNKDYDPEQYGIEIQMVKIKKLDLPDENKDAVYNRMITERKNIAAAYKAQGESEAQKIRNTTDRETAVMLSEAEATADRLEAEGEAEYMRILSDAYNDPDKAEYYLFVRQLDAAKKSLENGNTTLFLDSDSPLASIFEQ
ncbi:MAG: protease modulator HflC [Lachnospiraceae bacterium]|nr:protease modulator HflC [Lachnospiraceae bacterium]MBQ8330690.1 protease modulator HflC [Lachnospiraceae bacterium]